MIAEGGHPRSINKPSGKYYNEHSPHVIGVSHEHSPVRGKWKVPHSYACQVRSEKSQRPLKVHMAYNRNLTRSFRPACCLQEPRNL